MKRLIVLIALVVFPLSTLFAHPARDISATYEGSGLRMQVFHMVGSSDIKDMNKHFIKTVTVTLNGVKVAEKTYTSQSVEQFKEMFRFVAKKGDKIVITATCNLGGEKSVEKIVAR